MDVEIYFDIENVGSSFISVFLVILFLMENKEKDYVMRQNASSR